MAKTKHRMVIFEQGDEMIYEDYPRGRAKIANYVPTVPALRYLHCCTMAGWHRCNEQYGQAYQDEVVDAFFEAFISFDGE